MLPNKDIIVRGGLALLFIFFFARILAPVLFDILKNTFGGSKHQENDLDEMIRRQKERLRAQYGLSQSTPPPTSLPIDAAKPVGPTCEPPGSSAMETIFKEVRWGGGEFLKSIQLLIAKNYSYTLAESKINAFILLAEKKKFTKHLSTDNQARPESIRNYLSLVLVFMVLLEEIRSKEFFLLSKIANKCSLRPAEFALALQMKVLMQLSAKKKINDEKIYSDATILHQFSEDSMSDALESILSKEANIWARGHSLFIEELALHLNFAVLLCPIQKMVGKKDVATAREILGVGENATYEEIKKVYKKLALTRHPDIICSQKLPKILEEKAVKNFTLIQEAYNVLVDLKK